MPHPKPKTRPGPRPLPLHLSLSLAAWLTSPAGLMLSASGWNGWSNPDSASLLLAPPKQAGAALARAASAKLSLLLDGVDRYRKHPYTRSLSDPPVIWQEGCSRLLDFGGKGPVALFVPSLINKAYILDLDEKRSLLRWLTKQGIRPLLLDWGSPGMDERSFGLEDYVLRLERLLKAIKKPVHLVGYCMGGNLALAAALRQSPLVRSLALLATPWDFHVGNKPAALRSALLYRTWQPVCTLLGQLPVDLIQTLFTLLDPLGPQKKFIRFARLQDKEEAESFVALEDWLNDGIPLPLKAAEDCLLGWYENNTTAKGTWIVDSVQINPAQISTPTLVMIPEDDRIVHPASASALAALLPSRTRLDVPLGHVGMVVSREAPERVWKPLLNWLEG